jgi:hypothetical protein
MMSDVGDSTLKAINQNIASLVQATKTAFPTNWSVGTFICSAAASTTVRDSKVKANSAIMPFPTNAAASNLMSGATSLYISAVNAGSSFVLTTANSASAAGTETFVYLLVSPN